MNAIHPPLPMTPFMAPPDLMALTWIASHLREADKRECFAGPITAPEQLAIHAFQQPGICDVAWVHGEPAAAIGAAQRWPGVWSVWAWGTPLWHDVRLLITRHALRTMIPTLLAQGGHRGECASHEEHHEAHAWLEFLGFTCEGRLRGYARDRSDFLLYAWIKENADVLRRRRRHGQFADAIPATAGRGGPGEGS
jgi:hypothetical protein